jgi:hypothetical protein
MTRRGRSAAEGAEVGPDQVEAGRDPVEEAEADAQRWEAG